jgi:O-antigen/teichoic acid export membrane protein
MDLVKKNFYKDILIRGGSDFLSLIITIFTIHLLTKNLGDYQYGIFIQIQATTTLLAPVLLLRLNTAFVRYFPNIISHRGKLKNIFVISTLFVIILQIIFAFILFFDTKLVSKLIFNKEELNNFVIFIIIFTLSSTFFVFVTDFFRAINKIKYSSLISLSQTTLVFLFIAYSVFKGYGINAFLLSYIFSQIIITLVILFLIFNVFFKSEPLKLAISPMRPYLMYSLPLVPYSVLWWVNQLSSRYFIAHFLGLKKVGIYSLSSNIIGKAFILYSVIAYVIYPHISSLWSKGDSDQVKRLLEKGGHLYLFFAIPITAGLTFLSAPIITLIAGKDFIVDPLLILAICIGSIFVGMYGIYEYIIDLSQKTYLALFILIITATLNVILNILFIPFWDIMGAAIATLLTYSCQVAIIIFMSRKLINIRINLDLLLVIKCIIASIVMILMLNQLKIINQIYYVIFSIIIGSIIYFITTWIINGFKVPLLHD